MCAFDKGTERIKLYTEGQAGYTVPTLSVSLQSNALTLFFVPEGTGLCGQNENWLFLLSDFLSSISSKQLALSACGNSSLPLLSGLRWWWSSLITIPSGPPLIVSLHMVHIFTNILFNTLSANYKSINF